MSSKMFLLVDCNSFFASCEKVFNPGLALCPVVVLTSIDGIIIARSKEAKALGIPMGAPAFEWKEVFHKYNVTVFSSNFALYCDMSQRVMSTLQSFGYPIEVYSVDEAFLQVEEEGVEELAMSMKTRIKQWTGIDVSIGIGKTKVLAKLALELAGSNKIFRIEPKEEMLSRATVSDVWGIGKKSEAHLFKHGIYTAWDLAQAPDARIQKILTVGGLRLALELRGISVMEAGERVEPKKSISTARAFPRLLTDFDEISAVLAHYVSSIAEELREERQRAYVLSLWLVPQNNSTLPSACTTFAEPVSSTPLLIKAAHALLKSIYQGGLAYKKVGVVLTAFVPETNVQHDLFISQKKTSAADKVMQIVDTINNKWGEETLYFASRYKLARNRENRSPRYTTSWNELLTVKA